MEALAAGKAVRDIDFDIIFTSRLVRSKQTALIALTQVSFVNEAWFSYHTGLPLH